MSQPALTVTAPGQAAGRRRRLLEIAGAAAIAATYIFLVLTQFTQAVLGFSAIASAAALLPMMVIMMPLAATAPVLAQRVGTRNVLMTGVGFFTAGLALLALTVSAHGGYWSVLPGLLVVSVGIGLCMTPATTMITESLPADK